MKIILTGSIAMDRIMVYDGHFRDVIQPDKLHILSLSLLLNDLRETRGGVAANIAYSLALLGEKPELLGSVGKNAQEYLSDLQKLGVNTDAVHFSAKPTASFSVITDKDNCQVGGFYPGAMSDAATLSLRPWSAEEALVVISPHDPQQMSVQVAECQQLGKRLIYDVGQQANNISSEDLKAGIIAAEVMIVNDYEMGVIVQKTGWSEAEIVKKLQVCIITLGEKGCRVYSSNSSAVQEVAAVPVDQVIDPTGAGDAFRAGFLYGYARQWTPEKCAQLGSVVATFALAKTGSQEHTFTPQAVSQLYQEAYGESLTL